MSADKSSIGPQAFKLCGGFGALLVGIGPTAHA